MDDFFTGLFVRVVCHSAPNNKPALYGYTVKLDSMVVCLFVWEAKKVVFTILTTWSVVYKGTLTGGTTFGETNYVHIRMENRTSVDLFCVLKMLCQIFGRFDPNIF